MEEKFKSILLKSFEDLSEDDWLLIEDAVKRGDLQPEEVPFWQDLVHAMDSLPVPPIPTQVDDNFNAWLAKQEPQPVHHLRTITLKTWIWQAVAATLLLCTGVGAGLFMNKQNNQAQLTALSHQVQDLKEMMSLNLMQSQLSTADRLKGVQLVNDLPDASAAIIQSLVLTLNEDDNTNVRLSALESLARFAHQPEVRTALIAAIVKQNSPLVQMALAEIMKNYQVKGSLEYFQKSWEVNQMPGVVKDEIENKLVEL